MINETDIIEYFEELASLNKSILHDAETNPAFLEGDVFELINDIGGRRSDGWIMLLESGDGSIFGDNPSNSMDQHILAITICKPCSKGDKPAERTIFSAAKVVAQQILSRLEYDIDEGRTDIPDFDLTTVKYMKVSGFGDNHVGCRVEFPINDTVNRSYDPEQWTDDETP
ncbi:MAG: hypothetical protein WC760_06490 [Bacteroidia bacterium]|jgi:hypothetical protein